MSTTIVKKVNIIFRLDLLRKTNSLTWGELCDLLKISRTMIHYVRSGQRQLSERAVWRLSEAERLAGIQPPEDRIKITPAERQAAHSDLESISKADRHEIAILGHKIVRAGARLTKAQAEFTALNNRLGEILKKYPFGSKYNLKKTGD